MIAWRRVCAEVFEGEGGEGGGEKRHGISTLWLYGGMRCMGHRRSSREGARLRRGGGGGDTHRGSINEG